MVAYILDLFLNPFLCCLFHHLHICFLLLQLSVAIQNIVSLEMVVYIQNDEKHLELSKTNSHGPNAKTLQGHP